MTRELDTVGACDFGGRLTTSMTAHPKPCPRTGELHFFGYRFLPPFLTYHRLDAAGRAGAERGHRRARADDDPRLRHHRAARHLHGPADRLRLRAGDAGQRLSLRVERRLRRAARRHAARRQRRRCALVRDRARATSSTRSTPTRTASRIVIDVARYPELWRGGPDGFGAGVPAPLDDRPRRRARSASSRSTTARSSSRASTSAAPGCRHRYGYAVANAVDAPDARSRCTLVKYDLQTGAATDARLRRRAHAERGRLRRRLGDAPARTRATSCSTSTTPRATPATSSSSTPADLAGPPVAVVHLPQRVPFGFHGNWIPTVSRTDSRADAEARSSWTARGHGSRLALRRSSIAPSCSAASACARGRRRSRSGGRRRRWRDGRG